jgi:DNA-binding NarL/FixJ family response regulator
MSTPTLPSGSRAAVAGSSPPLSERRYAGLAPLHKQPVESVHHVVAGQPSPPADRQTLPAVLAQDGQQLQRPSLAGTVHREVIALDMIAVAGPQLPEGAVVHPYTRPADREASSVFSTLTRGEREVLQLLVEGKSRREIAGAIR